jgi:hypothetical protein
MDELEAATSEPRSACPNLPRTADTAAPATSIAATEYLFTSYFLLQRHGVVRIDDDLNNISGNFLSGFGRLAIASVLRLLMITR